LAERCFGYKQVEPRRRNEENMRKLLPLAGAVLLAGLLVTAVAASPSARQAAKTVRISTRTLPKLGTVLVNSKGLTLYMFVPDKQKRVTCTGACAAVWPPVKLAKGSKTTASGKVKARLLGSDANPSGGRVVTYNRWPLYTYVGDTAPGQAKGQALNLNGGLWYVLNPAGKVIRTKP
jgi:predicted lipoprotein with Yx(FWY)xxD motif